MCGQTWMVGLMVYFSLSEFPVTQTIQSNYSGGVFLCFTWMVDVVQSTLWNSKKDYPCTFDEEDWKSVWTNRAAFNECGDELRGSHYGSDIARQGKHTTCWLRFILICSSNLQTQMWQCCHSQGALLKQHLSGSSFEIENGVICACPSFSMCVCGYSLCSMCVCVVGVCVCMHAFTSVWFASVYLCVHVLYMYV